MRTTTQKLMSRIIQILQVKVSLKSHKRVYNGVVHNVVVCLKARANFVKTVVMILLSSYVILMCNVKYHAV